jgi:alkylation response protein AidB-like acyl-CoA dehydrogenase
VARSARPLAELLRVLGRGDSSVALVAAMHPAVLAFWLATERVPEPHASAWEEQRERIWRTAAEGHWWGTITSEPGSGGDIARTRARAVATGGGTYELSGQKHFGSGSGITSFMMTTARPDDGSDPDLFFLDVRGAAWDGSRGMRLIAEWDGQGMAATQSHAFAFEGYPVTRSAWPGQLQALMEATAGLIPCLFTAVLVGVVEAAYDAARERLGRGRDSLRPYEQVEWSRVEMDVWIIHQAYEGILRAIEEGRSSARSALLGKTVVAEHAEDATRRICRVLGGGSYSRNSPFGHWFEDVRALGFLRPPWGLAYDGIFGGAWPAGEAEAAASPVAAPAVAIPTGS